MKEFINLITNTIYNIESKLFEQLNKNMSYSLQKKVVNNLCDSKCDELHFQLRLGINIFLI